MSSLEEIISHTTGAGANDNSIDWVLLRRASSAGAYLLDRRGLFVSESKIHLWRRQDTAVQKDGMSSRAKWATILTL